MTLSGTEQIIAAVIGLGVAVITGLGPKIVALASAWLEHLTPPGAGGTMISAPMASASMPAEMPTGPDMAHDNPAHPSPGEEP